MVKLQAFLPLILTFLLTAPGCADDTNAGPDANTGSPDFPAPPDGEGVQLFSSGRIEPGQERIDCRYIALPDQAIDVARFEHKYTAGSHHMLVYPTDLTAEEIGDGETFDCATRGDLRQTGVAYGASEPTGELPYPSGVAMRLPANSVVLLESHYLNATSEPLDTEVRVNLWYAQEPVHTEAGTIFYRNWAIYLPPAPDTSSASMRCRLPQDVSLVYATSHLHRRGVDFRSQLIREGEKPMPLHSSQNWAAPTPTVYWPALELKAGDVVDFTCDFRNDMPTAVVEGESADTNEMCIFIGGYWPKMNHDAELCLADDSGPVLSGASSCQQSVECMLSAGVGNDVGGQKCIADTCAPSAQAMSNFVVCVEHYDCWGSESCVATNCADQWSACTAATCETK